MKQVICKYCVMDISDPDIKFWGGSGGCNRCRDARASLRLAKKNRVGLGKIASMVKRSGKGKKYDCVIGVSGGVDSSYVAHLVKKMGLNPIAVHLDNGWNSEMSVNNIRQILDKLNIDLYNYKVDWETFRDLQLAFLKASTPDSEIPTDHAIVSILYQVAAKYNIKYIIDGLNINSESVLPPKWSHGHYDWKYIKSIHSQFGTKRLIGFPHMNRWKMLYYNKILKIERIHILNEFTYDKEKTKKFLIKHYNWMDYGGKHYESFYTKFYQAYILPVKFGYDKRKAHLSSLIAAGQITREEALKILETSLYNEEELKSDIEFFLEKMEISLTEFNNIMDADKKTYWDYPNYEKDWLHRVFKI